jgi:hypothetical protein
MFRKTKRDRPASIGTLLIQAAEKHLGYHAKAGNDSIFGRTVGYTGLPWSGAFIDVVAREAGVDIPACVYSTSGLAEFIRQRAWKEKPQPGDIVFFNFATDDAFGMMHVGLVTDSSRWQTDGLVETIEAQVNSGLPKGSEVADGVYKRVRNNHEVLGFGRPGYMLDTSEQTGMPEIHVGNIRPGKRNKQIELVQLALSSVVGLRHGYTLGMYDGRTQKAYAHYQRIIGFVGNDATGIPDIGSLQRLGRETGTFTAIAG